MYYWFCPTNGRILDPFAGGSVRGLVAATLNREYVGIDLRAEQVEENRRQAKNILSNGPAPEWICGDSADLDNLWNDKADFIFSCPPYGDLEVYSDEPNDLSNMSYEEFRDAYFQIVAKSCQRLKKDRFASFVVGEIRDRKGVYRNFVGDTIEAFCQVGLSYYNESILVTKAGSLPLRAGKQFSAARKLGKSHQNVLIFVKGDPKAATDALATVELNWDEDQVA
jgi:DNA modification methylase